MNASDKIQPAIASHQKSHACSFPPQKDVPHVVAKSLGSQYHRATPSTQQGHQGTLKSHKSSLTTSDPRHGRPLPTIKTALIFK